MTYDWPQQTWWDVVPYAKLWPTPVAQAAGEEPLIVEFPQHVFAATEKDARRAAKVRVILELVCRGAETRGAPKRPHCPPTTPAGAEPRSSG